MDVVEVNAGFADIDPGRIDERFDLLIILAHEIINERLLDIGSVWAMYLAARHTIFLVDFERENDFSANPVIINTMRGGAERLAEWQWRDLPVRRGGLGDGSFFAALQGLFRTHGHEGFLGELAKFTTYLLAGMDLIDDYPEDQQAWSEYIDPSVVYLENVLSLHGAFAELLAFLPDKALIGRINDAVAQLDEWRYALKSHDMGKIGAYTQVADILTALEQDIIRLRDMLER